MERRSILTGRKEIEKFLGRSWKTISHWIEMGAPIAKIDRRWESDSVALLDWRRRQIQGRLVRPAVMPDVSTPRQTANSRRLASK